MSKKIVLFLTVILSTLTAASQAVGDWSILPTFTAVAPVANKSWPAKVIVTPSKVYILASNQLASIEKGSDLNEMTYYSSRNMLNDDDIVDMYYNYDKKYLFVAYRNSNIDLVYDNGKIVNMSEVKDAIMQKGKDINDVAFLPSKNKIYVATNFGLIVYDDNKYAVLESGTYNSVVNGVTVVDGNVVVTLDDELAYSPVDGRHISESSFTKIGNVGTRSKLENVSGNKLVALSQPSGALSLVTVDFANNSFAKSSIGTSCAYLGRSKDDIISNSSSNLYVIDKNGNNTTYALPAIIKNSFIGFYNNPEDLWAITFSMNGNNSVNTIGNYKLTSDGKASSIAKSFHPNASTARRVLGITVGNSGRVYPFERRLGKKFSSFQKNGQDSLSSVNSYSPTEGWEELYRVGGLAKCMELEGNPDHILASSFWGMAKVDKDGNKLASYNTSNTSFVSSYGACVSDFDTDGDGNLWCILFPKELTNNRLHKLPADKLNASSTTKSDWTSYKLWETDGQQGSRILACKKSKGILVCAGNYEGSFAVLSSENPNNATIAFPFIDQDGKSFSPEYIHGMVEDHNGKVWVATSGGVFEITDPIKFITNPVINRIKVPRNDGTNFADYLLDGIEVSGISVDNSNRKWLSTVGSGVYLVNEDGSEILEHFDTSNSYLPSDNIYAVAADPNSSKVYFGTENGLVEYVGDSSPAAEDYSEVYAYPNPVRPDYTGWITVTNLMDNSLVKITDAAGFVLYSTTSEGGMITWDGCNSAGERVKTGVYYVWASQNADGKSSGVVTKILVVN